MSKSKVTKTIKVQTNLLNKFSTRIFEVYIWIALALLIVLKPILLYKEYYRYMVVGNTYKNVFELYRFIDDYYWLFMLCFFTILFPILFHLIFGVMPIQSLRLGYFKKTYTTSNENLLFKKIIVDEKEYKNEVTFNKFELLVNYIETSKSFCNKMFNRSGVYLMVGCLIAFAGILLFYSQTQFIHSIVSDQKQNFDFSKTIMEFLPRFGTLIFIETIAFFFLRQYKIVMEEYRYYDAIKRQRENQMLILKIYESTEISIDALNTIVDKCNFNDTPMTLKENESTQILETRKLVESESNSFDKLIELLKLVRK